MLERNRLEELLRSFPERTVTVLGDFSLDRYCWAEVQGVSRERADPVHVVWKQTFNPGGAGNVAWNLADLGARVRAVCVVGDDPFASILLGCLERGGVDTSGVVPAPERQTTSYEKTRSRAEDGTVRDISLYADNRDPLSPAAEERVIAALDRALEGSDVLIVADYFQGRPSVVSDRVLEAALGHFGRFGGLAFSMSRLRLGEFRGSSLIGNEYETSRASGLHEAGLFDEIDAPTIARIAEELRRRSGRPAIVTCGGRGIAVSEDGQAVLVPTAPPRGEVDIVGAGDSALAGLSLARASGASWAEAAAIGNMVANVTIHKVHTTGTATPEEVLAVASHFEGLRASEIP